MRFEHLEFRDALENLAERAGIELNAATPKKDQPNAQSLTSMQQAAKFYQQQLKKYRDELPGQYCEQRGLSQESLERFAVGYAPQKWQNLTSAKTSSDVLQQLQQLGLVIVKPGGKSYDRFRHRLMFPIRDPRGRVLGFGGRAFDDTPPKYLNSPETSLFHKSKTLYGLYECLQKSSRPHFLIVAEGYMDVIMLAQYGFTNAVATLGTAIGADHFDVLFKYTSRIVFVSTEMLRVIKPQNARSSMRCQRCRTVGVWILFF